MKKYEDAIKALEALEGGAELVAAVNAKLEADVKAEKDRGIVEKKKVDNEAKGLRERLKKVTEPLGLDPEADDFDTSISSLKELKEKGTQKPNVETDPKYVALKKQMDDTAKKLEEREKRDAAAREKAVKAIKKATLTEALTKKKVLPDFMDDLQVALDSRLIVDEEDRVTWKGDADGEVLTVEDGLGKFLEKKTVYIANDQRPGGGSGGSAGGGTGAPKKEPSVDQRRTELVSKIHSTL